MGGRKSKSIESSSPFPNNFYQNQNQFHNNQGQNDHMNHNSNNHHTNHNHHRHNHAQHNYWNHRTNHNNHHHHHHHHGHNRHDNNFNQNSFNPNDLMNNFQSNPYENTDFGSFPPEDYPQDPFQHPDPRFLHQEEPRPIMNPNIDQMNNYRRIRRRPRRRLRRRRAFNPFVDGEFLAENNPEFFVDPREPRYLTNREVKFMKNTYWNPDDERASSSHSGNKTLSSKPNFSHSEQSEQSEKMRHFNTSVVEKSPIEKVIPPKLKKLRLKPFKPVVIPDIKFEHHDEPEPTSRLRTKNNVLARFNKKKYPTTFYAKPVRPKKIADEFHFKVFNNRIDHSNSAKYMVTSIRVPKAVNNELTIKVEQ